MRVELDRRTFLRLTATAGAAAVMLGFSHAIDASEQAVAGKLAPDAMLEIGSDDSITIWIPRQEMGQGVRTSLAMIVAEELDADWSRVRVIQAPFDAKYGAQRTGGSLSVRELWDPLRKTGATARWMLIQAAATAWSVPIEQIATAPSLVRHPLTARSASYGSLVVRASTLPVPGDVTLESRTSWRIIGRKIPRVDGPDIVTGRATYGCDVKPDGMLFATFVRCPVIGGKVRSFDAERARQIAGVHSVVAIDGTSHGPMMQWANGVAIVADSTWAALRGREALAIEWVEGANARWTQSEIVAAISKLGERQGTPGRTSGDVDAALSAGRRRSITSDYIAPYLSHSPLETMNCLAEVTDDRCSVRAPVQFPNLAHAIAQRITGLPADRVTVEISLLGGGFGRRIYADYVGEAVLIAKAVSRPVQLLWTREDDTQHGFYRPLSHHRMSAAIDEENGDVVAWRHRISGPSRDAVRGPEVETPERSEIYGANQLAYAIPNVRVEFNHYYVPIPCGPWRSVAYSQSGFVIECFVDELAHLAATDPVEFRLRLLADAKPFTDGDTLVEPARMRRVLQFTAAKAAWGKRQSRKGSGRGVAVTIDHGSSVAHVADVTVDREGEVRVERIVSGIDCGLAVNPDAIMAQVEGSIAMALSTLKSEITIDRGRIAQSSYADYDVIRMSEMPRVDVHILPSSDPPGGVGEPPLPGVAPAVLNAVFAATGRRVRRLPIGNALEGWSRA
ncbi:MAG TPA: molybdopterin cofactor-binding domain-containing protein [Thermoanaerobaculia bacterium]|nr:molybdopterin cofactor-binding domain-containing protein [Thermoanaerobaculia bacterium]